MVGRCATLVRELVSPAYVGLAAALAVLVALPGCGGLQCDPWADYGRVDLEPGRIPVGQVATLSVDIRRQRMCHSGFVDVGVPNELLTLVLSDPSVARPLAATALTDEQGHAEVVVRGLVVGSTLVTAESAAYSMGPEALNVY